MSTLKVTVEELVIHPHPNADALELAQVGMYRAVVGKGQYKTGDYALYIPEQAVLPPGLIDELGLTGRLAGSGKDRVKAIRLRGELSQGIVCRPAAMFGNWDSSGVQAVCEEGLNFAAELGITKWVPPVPVGMAGDVVPAPDLIPWVDIENIKRVPDMFEPGDRVIATEKVHGSCCLLTYVVDTDEVFVSSKGVGAKNLAIAESDGNLYWRAVRAYGLVDVAKNLAKHLGVNRLGLFGEVFGSGVQDLKYGADATRNDGIGYALFDIGYADGTGGYQYFSHGLWPVLAASGLLPVPTVPVLYDGPYDYDILSVLAEGYEQVSGGELHMREGLVVRSAIADRSRAHGWRVAKFVSVAYLMRRGGTEFE
jgi:RNA ligase (TIGR02306 family)